MEKKIYEMKLLGLKPQFTHVKAPNYLNKKHTSTNERSMED